MEKSNKKKIIIIIAIVAVIILSIILGIVFSTKDNGGNINPTEETVWAYDNIQALSNGSFGFLSYWWKEKGLVVGEYVEASTQKDITKAQMKDNSIPFNNYASLDFLIDEKYYGRVLKYVEFELLSEEDFNMEMKYYTNKTEVVELKAGVVKKMKLTDERMTNKTPIDSKWRGFSIRNICENNGEYLKKWTIKNIKLTFEK